MSSRIKAGLATYADNEDLLNMQAAFSMPGVFSVSYLREPDYFAALEVEGPFHQTMVGRTVPGDKIVMFGNRSVKPVFINGLRQEAGYLSGLRAREGYRNVFTMIRGYQYLKKLHQDQRVPFYLTTIVHSNDLAEKVITSKLRGLPVYHPFGSLYSKAISLPGKGCGALPEGVYCRNGQREDLSRVVDLLHEEGSRKQFFPCYETSDFTPGGLLKGLQPDDLLLAFREQELVGIVGAWDQRRFRATQINAYPTWMAKGRGLHNLWAKFHSLPALPLVKTVLNYFYLSLIAIRGDDQGVFRGMLTELMKQSGGIYDFMMLGLHSSHPLLPVLRTMKGYDYASNLYLVAWEDGLPAVKRLDSRPVYLELGAL